MTRMVARRRDEPGQDMERRLVEAILGRGARGGSLEALSKDEGVDVFRVVDVEQLGLALSTRRRGSQGWFVSARLHSATSGLAEGMRRRWRLVPPVP